MALCMNARRNVSPNPWASAGLSSHARKLEWACSSRERPKTSNTLNSRISPKASRFGLPNGPQQRFHRFEVRGSGALACQNLVKLPADCPKLTGEFRVRHCALTAAQHPFRLSTAPVIMDGTGPHR